MNHNQLKAFYPQRLNLRLSGFDYSSNGSYFVTICIKDKQFLMGRIEAGVVKLNSYGVAVDNVWREIPFHYPQISNDVFIVMPNHIHGIITIREIERAGSKPAPAKHPLSEIVRAFKTYSARKINELRDSKGTPVWQRNYFEHIIRNEKEFHLIGEYILSNPSKWETDSGNPDFYP